MLDMTPMLIGWTVATVTPAISGTTVLIGCSSVANSFLGKGLRSHVNAGLYIFYVTIASGNSSIRTRERFCIKVESKVLENKKSQLLGTTGTKIIEPQAE